MPPMCDYPKYLETKQKILKLYRVFFYGDVLGDLENEIELLYLQNKEIKWKKYVKSNVKN